MKFCFFGEISGALKGKTKGGGELQVALLARALAIEGHEVVIIDPFSVESFITIEGVKLITVPNWNKGIGGIRMFLYRIPALWKIFAKQNADFYYVRMRSYLHLIPYIVSKKTGGKFIQAIACDLDVLSVREKFKYDYKASFKLFKFLTVYLPNDLVFNYLLKRADYVILQHAGQLLRSTSIYGKMVIFANIIDCSNLPVVKNTTKNYFIHVGDLTMLKGSDNLYQLIKIIDKKNSIIIVGEPKDSKSEIIFKKLSTMENVVIKGRLSHNETLQLIANSKALINTSNYEGFPNIFLEAWATRVPVISLKVNPGNVFNKYYLGVYCESQLNKMKMCIESEEIANIDRSRLISYVCEFHEFNSAGDRFLKTINNA